MIGIIPVRTAVRTAGWAACQRVAPSDSRSSTSLRFALNSSVSRSRPSEMPLSVFPRIIPINGIAYCAALCRHDEGGMTPARATVNTNHELTSVALKLVNQIPG